MTGVFSFTLSHFYTKNTNKCATNACQEDAIAADDDELLGVLRFSNHTFFVQEAGKNTPPETNMEPENRLKPSQKRQGSFYNQQFSGASC